MYIQLANKMCFQKKNPPLHRATATAVQMVSPVPEIMDIAAYNKVSRAEPPKM
jgi:hypothetical protein